MRKQLELQEYNTSDFHKIIDKKVFKYDYPLDATVTIITAKAFHYYEYHVAIQFMYNQRYFEINEQTAYLEKDDLPEISRIPDEIVTSKKVQEIANTRYKSNGISDVIFEFNHQALVNYIYVVPANFIDNVKKVCMSNKYFITKDNNFHQMIKYKVTPSIFRSDIKRPENKNIIFKENTDCIHTLASDEFISLCIYT